LLFICGLLVVFSNVVSTKAQANTVTIPDDFSSIQAAINSASDGDTVFVKTGVYEIVEGTQLVINKTLSLIGEDPENTMLLGVFGKSSSSIPAIRVAAPNVIISGFTITGFGIAIQTANYYEEPYPLNCKITNNNIVNNYEGIRPRRNDLLVSENNITDNGKGIAGYSVQNITITGNNMTENGYGIYIWESRNVTVCNNNFSNNTHALNLVLHGPYFIYGNNITQNNEGIRFAEGCHNATIYGNNISQNNVAIMMLIFPNGGNVVVSGVGNTVFGNLFAENFEQLNYTQLNFEFPGYSMGADIIKWNNGTIGNYWDVYGGADENGDNIGDTPYILDENNQDNYPLINPIDPATVIPEFPSWLILPILATVTALAFFYKKKLAKTSNWH
jgi:parallel beta-helix repeat protein